MQILTNVKAFVRKNVRKGTTIYSDYAPVYKHLNTRYKHDRVLHAQQNVCKRRCAYQHNRELLERIKKGALWYLSSS